MRGGEGTPKMMGIKGGGSLMLEIGWWRRQLGTLQKCTRTVSGEEEERSSRYFTHTVVVTIFSLLEPFTTHSTSFTVCSGLTISTARFKLFVPHEYL